ncbi:MAG: plasmid stabilization protein [Sulfuricellaceae bacterium]|nr:plasmid stabilization protein [Sulfuricellaceae bacterium]
MASITIRNLDDRLKATLRQQAALHGCSMEEEVRQILRRTVMPVQSDSSFAQRIHQRFSQLDVDDLPIPGRQAVRLPPQWNDS